MNKKILASLMVAGFMMVGCNSTNTATGTKSTATGAVISGAAAKGPIAGGAVTVKDSTGAIVAFGTTNPDGTYNVTVPTTATAPFTLTINNGIDTITGVAQDFPLTTMVTKAPIAGVLTQANANANVFSTMIVAAVAAKAADDGYTAATPPSAAQMATFIQAQEAIISSSLNMGLPAGVSPMTGVLDPTNVAALNKANEALAETIRRTTVDNKKATAAANNANTAATALAGDFSSVIAQMASDASDGVLDGVSSQAALTAAAKATTGATPVTPTEVQSTAQVALVNSVKVIAEVVSDTLQVTDGTGAVVKDSFAVAQSLDTYSQLSVVKKAGVYKTVAASTPTGNMALANQMTAAVSAATAMIVADDYSVTSNVAVQTQKSAVLTSLLNGVKGVIAGTGTKVALSDSVVNDSYAFAAVKGDAATAAAVSVAKTNAAKVVGATAASIDAAGAAAVTKSATTLAKDIYAQSTAAAVVQQQGGNVNLVTATTAGKSAATAAATNNPPSVTSATPAVIAAAAAATSAATANATTASQTAATTVATQVAAAAKIFPGFGISANTFNISGSPATVAATGTATLAAPGTAIAGNVTFNFKLADYSIAAGTGPGVARTINSTLNFYLSNGVNSYKGSVPASIVTDGLGSVTSATIAANAVYTLTTIGGSTIAVTNLTAKNILTVTTGTITVNLSSLLATADAKAGTNVSAVIAAGNTVSYEVGFSSISLGIENGNATGLLGYFTAGTNLTTGSVVKGSFTR